MGSLCNSSECRVSVDSLVRHKSFLTLCVLYMQYHPDFLGESKYLGFGFASKMVPYTVYWVQS